ncbi:kinase-like domain-containing protein [Gigaspora rosea]|uniref:Kinase-like domain-containing protein n=1 Tax=Gigaspora rosea TaxID=44941 RepID=A0A397UM22_9GLOM|nr:kinase-like domain-containing protein [Gigaspora rosea]
MGRYEESLASLNKSLEIEQNNVEALSERGETYFKMNRFEESLADLYQLFAIESNNALRYRNCIEWISFDRLVDRQIIGKGGFGTVFSAIWLDSQSYKVALKTLNNFKEFENHVRCRLNGLGLEIYGITQDIETQKCLMVFQYANNGNLCNFLKSNFIKLDWKSKLMYLIDVANDLDKIHKSGYVHCDFHSGNILQHQYGSSFISSFITDLGLSKKLKESASKGDVYGVMPYIAPEILLGEQYTKASDIYSMGVIMAELSTGKRPFYDYTFDFRLASNICNGLRPGISERTPRCFIELAKQCMDSNPCNRPTAKDISSKLSKWRTIITNPSMPISHEESDIKRDFISANDEISQITLPNYQSSKYTSKLIKTKEFKQVYESAKSANFRGNPRNFMRIYIIVHYCLFNI